MKRFIKIPTKVFELDLSPIQLLVYAGIVSLKSKENYTIATAKTIAKQCNISQNSVYTAVNVLKSFGLINKTNYFKNGKKAANGYYVRNLGGNFIKLEYNIFKFQLSPSQFAVYTAIKSKCNHANRAFPSLRQISALANICIDTVISSVRKLSNKGLLLFKHYVRRCGCFGHNNYIISENPEIEQTPERKIIKLNISKDKVAYKKTTSLFLNKIRYSKFWVTRLDSLKYLVRNRINHYFNLINIHKLRV